MNCPRCGSLITVKQVQELNASAADKLTIDFLCECTRCGHVFETFADYNLIREVLKCVDLD